MLDCRRFATRVAFILEVVDKRGATKYPKYYLVSYCGTPG
jgi:hypothetical protein